MFSKFFIDRPIFATVLAIIMVLVGLMTVKTLPVAQFPDITPPTVMVSASYPGADAKTVAESVGVPIEEQVNGVEGMMYMSSTSSDDGSYSLTITFEVGTDIDMATVKVQNRVSLAEAQLPNSVQREGVDVMSRSSNQILFIALEGDSAHKYDALYLTNYAQLNIVDELSRIDGVGDVGAFGGGDYSMRVWLDPQKMQARGVSPADVTAAIEGQNVQVSAGSVGNPPQSGGEAFEYTLVSQGRLTTPEEFGNIIIRTGEDGSILHLSDVAKVELGSQSYSTVSKVSGKPAGLLGISQLPGANALTVANACLDKLDDLAEYFPPGVHYRVILNTTDFVTASIDEVLVTFVETTLIVMVVILLFLQSFRATIIPMITIPVSLIATFAVMKLLGFSLNTLTLFGLVLAIAIVVDDAIVVVEDCSRIIDEGKLSVHDAVVQAMKELTGPVIGEVLVLLSVFIPTAFISGITGELYKQFALTIAVSTAFSGFNALTFTPAMCVLFLRPKQPVKFKLFRWFNEGFGATTAAYVKLITRFLKRPYVALGIYALICFVAFWGFMKWPTSYVPEEDMGYFMTSVQLPTGASLDRTTKIMDQISAEVRKLDGVKDVMAISGASMMGGGNGSNSGSLFIVLEPWKDRRAKDLCVNAMIKKVGEITSKLQEPVVFSVNPPSIPGLGLTSGMQMQLLDIRNQGTEAMHEAIETLQEGAKSVPELAQLTTFYQGTVPQYKVSIDRDKVAMQGLSLPTVFSTLSAFMGGSYVNDFVEFDHVYEVMMAAQSSSTGLPDDVLKLSVANADGEMVPFASFTTVEPVMGDPSISRYNMYTTASVTGVAAEDVSSHDVIVAMEQLVKDKLGDNYSFAWTGEAYQEAKSGTTISTVLLFAVVITILVLAAQYESWTNPLAVVMSMPTAILGAVIGCIFLSQSISIYTQIGIILLLGLSAKNAILMVGYSVDYRKAGMPIPQAAADGGRVRFRPIMMTALAFVLGVLPMLFATGAGAQSRISLGTAVVFGMAVNAVVGTLFVPNFWELMQRFLERYLSKVFGSASNKTPGGTTGNSPTQSEP